MRTSSRFREWTWTNQLTYKNTFAQHHDLNVLVGTEAGESWGRAMGASRADYITERRDFWSLNGGCCQSTKQRCSVYSGLSCFLFWKGRLHF